MGEMTIEQQRALALARARQRQAQQKPQTNLAEQVGTGTSEGIANVVGMPVDLMTAGLNKVGGMFGMQPIQQPVGGSESIKGLLDPFMSDVEPQTMAQRIGRRVGQDVGGSVVTGPLAGAPMGMNVASALASGTAGGLTSEVTDNPIVNTIVSILAGMGPAAASKAMRPDAVPTNAQLRAKAGSLYDQVENSPLKLSTRGGQTLKGNVSARMYDERMKPSLHPEAAAAVDEVWDMADRPTLWDVEQTRRFVNRNAIPADNPEKARLGGAIKREIDDFVDRAAPGHPDVEALKEARTTSRKYIASEGLDTAIAKAQRRAATSGSGGNEINTTRQNIRAILDNPKKAAGYTEAERKAMEDIVRGTTATNRLRQIGALSPDRGALPLMGGLVGAGGAGAAAMSGNVGTASLMMTPSVVGYVAKQLGEHLTDKQVQNLSRQIRYGGVPPAKTLTEGERRVVAALLANQAAQGQQ